MSEKLYGQIKTVSNPDGFDEFVINDPDNPSASFNGEETININTGGIIKALRVKWFKGSKGEKGDPGNVVWGNYTVSSVGAALITATTAAAMRAVLGISAIGSNLITGTTASALRSTLGLGNSATHNYGTTLNSVAQGNDLRFVPAKSPIPFWGTPEEVPTGWYLCDGTNGTPDMRNRMIIGVGSNYTLGETGGSKDAIVVTHTHNGNTESSGAHTHKSKIHSGNNMNNSGKDTDDRNVNALAVLLEVDTTSSGAHTHPFITEETGETGADANLPPYIAMNYIMHF